MTAAINTPSSQIDSQPTNSQERNRSFLFRMVDGYQQLLLILNRCNFISPLLIRCYLAPIFIVAGYTKLQFGVEGVGFFGQFAPDPNIVSWFGNPDWGLGLPAPQLLAFLAAWTEFLGGWMLLLGVATRLISIPLMFTMVIAATTVHWDNGWFAVAPTNPETSTARALAWVGIPGAEESLASSEEAGERLTKIRSLLSEHGNTDWLYEKGSVVVLNNGIEFSATYFILCLVLLFCGAGRYVSADYWLARRLGVRE